MIWKIYSLEQNKEQKKNKALIVKKSIPQGLISSVFKTTDVVIFILLQDSYILQMDQNNVKKHFFYALHVLHFYEYL